MNLDAPEVVFQALYDVHADERYDFLLKLSGFLDSVDKSYFEYEDKIKFISRSLELSSQELNVSNRQLENLNEAINTMLNSLGQGLVFFDSQGECSNVCSKACEKLLDQLPSNKKIYDVLKLSDAQKNNFLSWLEIVYNPTSALSFSDVAELAPDHYLNLRGEHIQLDYKPVYDYQSRLTAILLIATDKTFEKRAEEALREKQTLSQTIVSISQNRNEFVDFMRSVNSFLSDISERGGHDLQEVMREIHTYKGLAAHFGLDLLCQSLDNAENILRDQGSAAVNMEMAALIRANVQAAHQLATGFLGQDYMDRGQVRTIDLDQIRALRERISNLQDPAVGEIKAFIDEQILGADIEECFSVFSSEIARLASLQGKPIPVIRYHSDVTSFILADYRVFFESLIHVARNIMDHGIEAVPIRRKADKSDRGFVDITLRIGQEGDRKVAELAIADDGQGLNAPHLRRRLETLGLHTGDVQALSDHDVIQYIFHPGFSSRSSATALSGRGVGMYAVSKAIQDMGGTYHAEPAQPGTLFTFRFPL